MVSVSAQYLFDVIEVPMKFTKGATDEAVGFSAMHHDRTNRCGVRAHDGPSDVR